jgi:hypothetical protein
MLDRHTAHTLQRSVANAVHQVQRFKGSIPFSGARRLPAFDRATVTPLSPPLPPQHLQQAQTDVSITIRPLVLTPAQRVSDI